MASDVCIMPIYVENMEFAFSNTEIKWIGHCDSMGSRATVNGLGKVRHAPQTGREQRGMRNKCLNVHSFLGYSSYLELHGNSLWK